jgi:hypothetical protein
MTGPTSHVNLPLVVKVISSYLSDHLPFYKRPLSFRPGVRDHFPLSPCELLELSTHPIMTTVHLQYQTTRPRAITSKEGPKPGLILVCFVVRKTISEQERMILTTFHLTGAKKHRQSYFAL